MPKRTHASSAKYPTRDCIAFAWIPFSEINGIVSVEKETGEARRLPGLYSTLWNDVFLASYSAGRPSIRTSETMRA
jgi:hypothetical protein